jgi:cytochrome c peroxidase
MFGNRRSLITITITAILAIWGGVILSQRISAIGPQNRPAIHLNAKQELGKAIFFDTALSSPEGMSCSTCHTPAVGFSDTLSRMTSEGAVKGLFANRNSMSACYTMYIPSLHFSKKDGSWVGGLFWDGRARSLADQASKPFVNPLEMHCSNDISVAEKVKTRPYFTQLLALYRNPKGDEAIFKCITDALAAYKSSPELNPFSSKFDAVQAGKSLFTAQEQNGLDLFKGKGKCAQCHVTTNDPKAHKVLFTDHTYDNLGIPRNEHNRFLDMPPVHNPEGHRYVDLGLGPIVKDPMQNGKFRVPTLRNIALTAPYGHNGYFNTLEEIVHFYNVRDDGKTYPHPEYPATVNHDEMGNLGLTPAEEADIVSFLKTLTDGYTPAQDKQ